MKCVQKHYDQTKSSKFYFISCFNFFYKAVLGTVIDPCKMYRMFVFCMPGF